MLPRIALVSTGLAVALCVGLTGTGVVSAAAPALHIKPGSQWTEEVDTGACAVLNFQSNFTVTDNESNSGTWTGGRSTLRIKWTAGGLTNTTFEGTFTKVPVTEYVGIFHVGPRLAGQVVKGVVPIWNGQDCLHSPPSKVNSILHGTPAAGHPTVGTYTLHVDWNNSGWSPPMTLTLSADHTATAGLLGTWTIRSGKITINIGGGTAIFHGRKTARGFNSRKDLGKAIDNAENFDGVWYAVYAGS
jgi:hypothetical protein